MKGKVLRDVLSRGGREKSRRYLTQEKPRPKALFAAKGDGDDNDARRELVPILRFSQVGTMCID